jgi:hypothetical protein
VLVDRFQERAELIMKTSVLLEIHSNIQFKQSQRSMFVALMAPVAEKRME